MKKEIPIHPGFQFLTDVHKSDYARAYLMYFYGGGYSDIKANSFDWNPYFDQLFASKYDAFGYAEKRFQDVVQFWEGDAQIKNFVKENYFKFAGNGHYIFKPRSRFAHDWLDSIHKLMDRSYEQLKHNPGLHPYMVRGGAHDGYKGSFPTELEGNSYPFAWADLCGNIKHRLEYEYQHNAFNTAMPYTNTKNYR